MSQVRSGFKFTEFGEIPEDWRLFPFHEIVQQTKVGTPSRGSNGSTKEIALLKMGNIVGGGFDLNDLEYVAEQKVQNLNSLLLDRGDYLFNTRNASGLVGKSA